MALRRPAGLVGGLFRSQAAGAGMGKERIAERIVPQWTAAPTWTNQRVVHVGVHTHELAALPPRGDVRRLRLVNHPPGARIPSDKQTNCGVGGDVALHRIGERTMAARRVDYAVKSVADKSTL